MIPFNAPAVVGTELGHVKEAIDSGVLRGGGDYTRRCEQWLSRECGGSPVLLTPSCTAALEIAAILLDIRPGDEVIMPSFTFVSTANAFVLRGARIVFVDVRPDTMNIDETRIESAITSRTKAIVPVHYGGVACEMDTIMALAKRHRLRVVEDAAQAVRSTYRGRPLGGIGDLGCYSFHETKGYTAGGEGGAIVVNDPALAERAEVIREKGTNRGQLFRGEVSRYTWLDVGSSYLMSELQAAYLCAQLDAADLIDQRRRELWRRYQRVLRPVAERGRLELQVIPPECGHNAHMFYVKLRDLTDRTSFIDTLRAAGVMAPFHYVPLHTSPAGRRFGVFRGADTHTSGGSDRLARLPLFYNMTDAMQHTVLDEVRSYCG